MWKQMEMLEHHSDLLTMNINIGLWVCNIRR